MVLRSSLLAAATIGAFAISMNIGHAADLYDNNDYSNTYQPTYSSPPPADWTGSYLGAMLGYNWGTFDPNTGAKVDVDGLLFGAFAGYNFQAGALVFGGEVDVAITSMDGTAGVNDADADWVGSVRGRLGYTWDRHMIYGTAGVGFMSADVGLGGVNDDKTHTGLVGGVGFESMLNKSFSARAEYLYTAYGDKEYSNIDTDANSHAVRAGLGYHF
ncbi:MAG: outer membrane beta-barrel protein [Hyphomicrobiales bacterium]|uniref:outer membrane protein n=1 Tax=Nisaea sp. TaxID=2024842 RepID=UPI0032818751